MDLHNLNVSLGLTKLLNLLHIHLKLIAENETMSKRLFDYCQAQVQVPDPLSQQAPNPDPKFRPKSKKKPAQPQELCFGVYQT